mmetsp:Transcript_22015/g.62725  ORF Transcript_22015/g.62725 Transcript_22015/m.62725 type:complete len:142 (-) Transcript_22015:995-1420(-)
MIRPQAAPVVVLRQNTKREQGRKAQLANIQAGMTIADIVRTTLGPKSMLKMLLDPMGGIVMTNDGNAILREVDVAHPAAKSMIELSRSQDEEVGDGMTSVVVLAAHPAFQARCWLWPSPSSSATCTPQSSWRDTSRLWMTR